MRTEPGPLVPTVIVPGTGGGMRVLTVRVTDAVEVAPPGKVAVTLTWYVPAVPQVWSTWTVPPELPSPKSQCALDGTGWVAGGWSTTLSVTGLPAVGLASV